MSDERKLATIEQIQSLTPIPGADKIETARIRGWDVVVQKDLYTVGSKVIYLEVDTMVDVTHPLFEFLASRGVRTDSEGRTGHVVKTIRLKGQYSQGLVIPWVEAWRYFSGRDGEFGTDLTNDLTRLGPDDDFRSIWWKWEPPIPANLSGKVRGRLPGWVRKTDAERIQNMEDYLPLNPEDFYCTEKIDGSSATFTLNGDDFHVCSRNLDLEETEGNTFWEIARRYRIREFLEDMLREQTIGEMNNIITLQGEVYGEGINGNRLGLKGTHFAAFNFEYAGKYVPLGYVKDSIIDGIPLVPLLSTGAMGEWADGPHIPAPQSVDEALEAVDGLKSQLAKDRLAEGVVWRRRDGRDIVPGIRAVKAISNKYLLKEK